MLDEAEERDMQFADLAQSARKLLEALREELSHEVEHSERASLAVKDIELAIGDTTND